MTDAIVVAGGDNARRIQFAANFRCSQHKITVCQSLGDFKNASVEHNLDAIIILYQDDSGFINDLFNSEIIS